MPQRTCVAVKSRECSCALVQANVGARSASTKPCLRNNLKQLAWIVSVTEQQNYLYYLMEIPRQNLLRSVLSF